MMKTYLTVLFCCLCFAASSNAAGEFNSSEPESLPDVVEPQTFNDEFAEVKVSTVNNHDSTELHITLLCKDRRLRPNAMKPKLEKIYRDETCFVLPVDFDPAAHHISVIYSRFKSKNRIAHCSDDVIKGYQLDLMCKDWQ